MNYSVIANKTKRINHSLSQLSEIGRQMWNSPKYKFYITDQWAEIGRQCEIVQV